MKTIELNQRLNGRRCQSAFTFVELLVVLVMLGFLAALLAPAFAKTKPGSQAFVCLNNMRLLNNAWQMYHEEYNGRLVMTFYGGDARDGAAVLNDPTGRNAPWALGWLDWSNRSDNTNMLWLADSRYSYLAKYLNHSASLFKCPADTYVSSAQKAFGFQRARSYSANLNVGDGNVENGPWDTIYKHIKKISDFQYPSPAETYVYTEEHPDSINDPGIFSPHATQWVDIPATYHNGGCGYTFADGHAELHKWTASLTALRARQVLYTDGSDMMVNLQAAVGDADIHWVSYRAGRRSTNSY